jgi:hypothetical protein
MSKQQTVYIRKKSQLTLQKLSERTRLSQSEILAQWLESIQTVLDRFENLPYDRLSMASYPSAIHKQVCTMFAPIITNEVQIDLVTSEFINENLADLAIAKDLEKKLETAKEGCGLSNCGQHSKKKE